MNEHIHWEKIGLLIIVMVSVAIVFFTVGKIAGNDEKMIKKSSAIPTMVREEEAPVTLPIASAIETPTSGIYFESGSIVTATGFIKENIKQIDAPSYLLVFESEKSEDHLFKVFYAGDLCRFPLKSGFDFGLEVKIIIRGKAVDRQNISVCDDESFFVEAVPDLSNNTLVPRVLVLIEPSVPL